MIFMDISEFLRIAEHRLRENFVEKYKDKEGNINFGWSNQDMRGFEDLNRFFLGYLVELHNFILNEKD